MSSAVKLMLSFAVSVALHAAGLWAAAGSLEPRQAEASVEVAIVDRDLFFRHASRTDVLASQSLSATERLQPVSSVAARPSDAGASLDRAPATAATEAEPERRSAETAASEAVARLDLSTVESTPSPRPEAVAPEDDYAQASEPERMSGVAAEPSLAASPPRVQPSTRVVEAASAREPDRVPVSGPAAEAAIASPPPLPAAEDVVQAPRAEVIVPAPEKQRAQNPAEAGPPLSSASPAETLRRTSPEAAERRTVDVVASPEAAPPPAPIAPREAQSAQAVGAPAPPRRAAPPAERIAARAPLSTPFRPPMPDPATDADAAPRDLAALPPGSPPEASDRPASGGSDPANRFTSAYPGGECFFPLQVASQDGAIQGYGVDAESLRIFRQALAQKLGRDPDVVWRPLTDAQCGGISFTRLILGEAAPSVHIGLERKELALGETLSGRVTGSRFEFVTLLIVDDGGLVHNVLKYLRPGTAGLEFSVPVQPVDEGVDRVQLIMAVGASKPLAVLKWTTAVHSDDFFPELVRQAVETGASLELGLADFVILGDS